MLRKRIAGLPKKTSSSKEKIIADYCWQGLILSDLFWGFLLTGLFDEEYILPSAICFGIAFISYILLIRESFSSKLFHQICTLSEAGNAVQYINKIKAKAPNIRWTGRCSHQEKRTYQKTETYTTQEYGWPSATSTSSELMTVSKTRQVPQETTVRINTHQAAQSFSYSDWKDISGELSPEILKSQIVRLICSKEIHFRTSDIQEQYQQQRDAFIQEHQGRDEDFDVETMFTIHDFQDNITLLSSPNHCPKLLGKKQYQIATFLGFSWLYRMILQHVSKEVRFCFKKEVS